MLRPAGKALKWLFSKPGLVKGAPDTMLNAGDLAMRLGLDAGFAGLTFVQTPGDLADKSIAAGSQLVGGAGMGLLGGRLGGRNEGLSTLLDTGFSVGGDFLAMPVGDAIARGKDKLMGGRGETSWERMGREQQEELMNSTRTQVLAELGLLPAEQQTYLVDQQLVENGLGA